LTLIGSPLLFCGDYNCNPYASMKLLIFDGAVCLCDSEILVTFDYCYCKSIIIIKCCWLL